ncbi:MAG: C/D box methylation guide ribonucleoprotein complex aNOP56 subunit [Candidatus Bathyarchaeota archaeon]|nr:C/D box methylation guide ribonucleoprotein complex aNOP56 subunit [Candidatus Bathyarchaeota archaeon]
MKATIIVSAIGVLGVNDKGVVVSKVLFKKDPKLIAEKLELVAGGRAIEEPISLAHELIGKGYDSLTFENAAIAEHVRQKLRIKVNVDQNSPAGEHLRENMEGFSVDIGFVRRSQELRQLIRQVSTELARLRVKRAGEKRDLMIVQSILTIDDLDRTTNLLMSRIREWYGMHFPELDRKIESHQTYARLVLRLGGRLNFTADKLKKDGLSAEKAGKIGEAAEKSIGAELRDLDIERIRSLCKHALELYKLRRNLQDYSASVVEEVAPNTQALVGSLLTARLIALAGGLTNLAKMPASTIQVLGAEKALFRALKTGTSPPKHGVIFQEAVIHDAKKWQRGKISRALAGKLAIAARTDAFSGRYIGDSLKAGLNKRVQEIKKKYPEPSKRTRSIKPPRRKGRKKRGHHR